MLRIVEQSYHKSETGNLPIKKPYHKNTPRPCYATYIREQFNGWSIKPVFFDKKYLYSFKHHKSMLKIHP